MHRDAEMGDDTDVHGMRALFVLAHGIGAENDFIRMYKAMITICFFGLLLELLLLLRSSSS